MGRRVGPHLHLQATPQRNHGHLLGFIVGTVGKGVLEKAFENSVKTIELRNRV